MRSWVANAAAVIRSAGVWCAVCTRSLSKRHCGAQANPGAGRAGDGGSGRRQNRSCRAVRPRGLEAWSRALQVFSGRQRRIECGQGPSRLQWPCARRCGWLGPGRGHPVARRSDRSPAHRDRRRGSAVRRFASVAVSWRPGGAIRRSSRPPGCGRVRRGRPADHGPQHTAERSASLRRDQIVAPRVEAGHGGDLGQLLALIKEQCLGPIIKEGTHEVFLSETCWQDDDLRASLTWHVPWTVVVSTPLRTMILASPRIQARVAAPRTVIAQYSLALLEVVAVMRNTGRTASYDTNTDHIEGLKSSKGSFQVPWRVDRLDIGEVCGAVRRRIRRDA
jgi:hypothetical protein